LDDTSRFRVRWFAAQFLVIVTGVLVALAVQALYERGQARGRERAYLSQLRIDLDQTIDNVHQADLYVADADSAVLQLVRAFRITPPPEDSIVRWLAASSRVYAARPVLGTADALISSGDLRLIRNDSLRAKIPTYITVARRRERALEQMEDHLSTLREQLDHIVDWN
jgi:hypothetical protein